MIECHKISSGARAAVSLEKWQNTAGFELQVVVADAASRVGVIRAVRRLVAGQLDEP